MGIRVGLGNLALSSKTPRVRKLRLERKPTPVQRFRTIQLVPPERRSKKFPCRHTPLDASGETLDSLYRYCDQREINEKVGK